MKSTADKTTMQTAYLGLGVMGYPMAGHLASHGYAVCVYNRTAAKATAWTQDYAGHCASTPAAAAKGADVVFACVGNDSDIEEICCAEDGAFASMKSG